ncbi:hypothetical protein Bbelb_350020 [Branchiostoma belcheri]|nr:hypothetical protein Bbelb_350020 [Branchiostoma belcheri]
MREGTRPGSRLSKLEQDLSAGCRLEFSISESPEVKLKWQKDYGGEVGGIVDSDALCDEWWGLREYIAQNRHLSLEQLVKLLLTDATVAELYPSMKLLASVLMVIPVSTADSERAFSTLKRVKTRLRSSLKTSTLNNLLTISIDGPHIGDFNFEEAATVWFMGSANFHKLFVDGRALFGYVTPDAGPAGNDFMTMHGIKMEDLPALVAGFDDAVTTIKTTEDGGSSKTDKIANPLQKLTVGQAGKKKSRRQSAPPFYWSRVSKAFDTLKKC